MSSAHRHSIAVAAFGALLVGSAFAQSKGTAAPPAGTSGGSGTTTGNTGTAIPNATNSPGIFRPIYLSGRVVTDDGTPLPEPAAIVRVCNGSPHSEGHTDPAGNFGIELGNEMDVMRDASEAGDSGAQMPGSRVGGLSGGGELPGMGGTQTAASGPYTYPEDRKLTDCELEARLSGFRSQRVQLAALGPLSGTVDVGTILVHRATGAGEGKTVSATSLAAPRDARRAFEKGLELAKKNKVDDAFREYQKAVTLYPAYATAWCELGKIEANRGQADVARGSFNEALKADPKYVDPYLQLSRIALDAKNWPELAQFTGKALELDSFDYPQEFFFDAVAHYNMNEFDRAEKSILRADALDTRRQFPEIVHLKGMVMVERKNYAGAAESFRTYLKLAPNAEDAGRVREQLAQVEKYISGAAAKQ